MVAGGLVAGRRQAAHQARALPPLHGPPRSRADPRGDRGTAQLHRDPDRGRRGRCTDPGGRGRGRHPALPHSPLEPRSRILDPAGGEQMSREIVEAIKGLEQEKGIDADTLMEALEDALLSAYKKTPGAAKYARVDMDRRTADFRVFELILPPELEEKLVKEAIESEQTIDPERLAEYEDQIDSRDVTPTDFGRIAAQTAKQVILQRIREAERDMMFEE